jgi:phosphate transport system permease protein
MMKHTKRQIKDQSVLGLVSAISLFGILILFLIFGYVFKNGASLVSWDLLTDDYYAEVTNSYYAGSLDDQIYQRPGNLAADVYFSSVWGVAFADDIDQEGQAVIRIVYVDPDSPLTQLQDKNTEGHTVTITAGVLLDKVIFTGNIILYSSHGAEVAALQFDSATGIRDCMTSTEGKGIRGSIITTFLLIFMTLIIAIPFGVFTAIYLHEFAPKKSKLVFVFRRLIEMLSGMPSIIFGLMGAAVFIPFTSTLTAADGGNLFSGAMTLAVIVLPTLISSTEEALKVVPDEFRFASLALGANKTQTTFRVVLRGAIPGILTGTLLAIGRIIGESAALIYAIGTAIKDEIILTERSTSLAVHIWSIMSGEVPNFELASAISLIILVVVLILSLFVKIIARKYAIDPAMRG